MYIIYMYLYDFVIYLNKYHRKYKYESFAIIQYSDLFYNTFSTDYI